LSLANRAVSDRHNSSVEPRHIRSLFFGLSSLSVSPKKKEEARSKRQEARMHVVLSCGG
jgi:hypothetical protein